MTDQRPRGYSEQETGIIMNRADAYAEVWSDVPSIVARLRRCPWIEEAVGSDPPTFRCPQKAVKLKLPGLPVVKFVSGRYKRGVLPDYGTDVSEADEVGAPDGVRTPPKPRPF